LADEVEGKVTEYLGAGIPIVWVVSPKTQTVRIHRPQTSPRDPVSRLGSDDLIDGEDISPGFSCPVRDFFA
jgi:Uma2 family endonuclease